MTNGLVNLATFRRFLWDDANLVVTVGAIGPVIDGMNSYNARHEIGGPPPELLGVVTRLLAGVGLAAVSLPERESWGWTLAMPESALGIFVGIEPEGMICCRLLQKIPDRAVAMIQRKAAGEPLRQSTIEAPGPDPSDVVRRYFHDVEQNQNRLAIDAAGKGVFVHALPGGAFERVAQAGDLDLIAQIDRMQEAGGLKPLAEVLLFYECRCHEEMIIDLIEKLPGERREEIWGDRAELEIECPRCARAYVIRKKEAVSH